MWTVIRSLTNGVNFDVVGQIGVTSQWAHGMHNGAQLGATNYLLKMPFYFVVNQLGFLSPHAKLLLLALVFNIATFVLLIVLFEKLLRLYKLTPNNWFYLTMLWLASISGRVYWLDYANSRNLETVGGIWVLYLGLRLLQKPDWRRAVATLGVGGIVFFADQLQLYIIGGGLVLYAGLLWLHRRSKRQFVGSAILGGSIIGGYIVAKILTTIATTLLPVSFLVAPKSPQTLSLHSIEQITLGFGRSTARIFDSSFYSAASAPNMLREFINAVVLVGLVLLAMYLWRQAKQRSLATVCGCCILAAYGAYGVSGQASQPTTERYLIMVPLLLVLLCSSLNGATIRRRLVNIQWALAGILLLSAVLTFGALVVSWPERYSKDAYITNTLTFLQQHNFDVAVSSRNGIPVTYFSNDRTIVVPAICSPDRKLIESDLFFDKAAFATVQKQANLVPIIIPAGGIRSGNTTCTVQDIEAQLGQPSSQLVVPGIGIADLYQPNRIRLAD